MKFSKQTEKEKCTEIERKIITDKADMPKNEEK